MGPAGEITRLISDWQRGAPGAESALFDALYKKLHSLALQCLQGERRDQAPGATSLVHEAYLRFRQAQDLEIVNSSHLLALAARVMRRIVVDRARARRSEKRGGDAVPIEISDALVSRDSDADQILAACELAVSKRAGGARIGNPAGFGGEQAALRGFGGPGDDADDAIAHCSCRCVL